VLRHRVYRIQPFRVFRSIGPRRVCIQDSDNGSANLYREGRCIPRTISLSEYRQEGGIAISVLLTCARLDGLSNTPRLSRIKIGADDWLTCRETQCAPTAQLPSTDEKYGGASGFLTG